MAVRPQVLVVAGLAALSVLGIAIGAETQKETFLHPEQLQEAGVRDAASNLVTLSALLPALGITAVAVLLSQRPVAQRAMAAPVVFVSAYLLGWLVQSSWPNYDAAIELRTATFSITPLISNGDAAPSVFLGPLALLLALAMALRHGLRRLVPREPAGVTPETLVRRFVAAFVLAAPFLVILALGNLRLLLALPDGQARTTPYLVVFPLAAFAALGLIVTGSIKAWHLGAFARNSRLADGARDAWNGLRRAEWALAGVLVALALLGTMLAAIPSDLLEAGRTLGLTTRGHVQAQLLLMFPLLPWFLMDRRVQQGLEAWDRHGATLEVGTHPVVLGAWIALAVGATGALLATWFAPGALWAWALLLTPVAVFAWLRLAPGHALWPSVLLATVLWGIGNTVTGQFSSALDTPLSLETPPGVLALFRVLAVLVLAVAVARLVRHEAHEMRPTAAWPLAVLAGTGVAFIVFLEMAFTAWVATQEQGEFVAIGSVVASLDPAVRATVHVLTSLLGAAIGVVVARIHRPEWFGRPPPLPALAPIGAAA